MRGDGKERMKGMSSLLAHLKDVLPGETSISQGSMAEEASSWA